jgi:hypothetical protein
MVSDASEVGVAAEATHSCFAVRAPCAVMSLLVAPSHPHLRLRHVLPNLPLPHTLMDGLVQLLRGAFDARRV